MQRKLDEHKKPKDYFFNHQSENISVTKLLALSICPLLHILIVYKHYIFVLISSNLILLLLLICTIHNLVKVKIYWMKTPLPPVIENKLHKKEICFLLKRSRLYNILIETFHMIELF